jgi:hypothetical protein
MIATCSAQLIFPDFIALMILHGEYELWSSSLCRFLRSALTFCLLSLNNFVTTRI